MRKITWLFVLFVIPLVFISSSAEAEIFCEEPNLFALTFDLSGNILNLNDVPPNTQYPVHLFLLNPESDCMRGFEVEIHLPDDTLLLSTTFPGNAINVGEGTNFIVGFQLPEFSTDNRILLCTMTMMNTNNAGDTQDFYLSPTTPASIPGSMAFLDFDMNIIPAQPISLDYALPVARVNGTEPLDYCSGNGINGLTVQISSQGDTNNMAGTSSWATDGFDAAFDLIDEDPDPVVFFAHPEWSAPDGDYFRQDIMGDFDPNTTTQTWSFSVNSTIPEGVDPPYMVEVEFLPSFAGDENIFMTIVDQTTGQTTVLEDPYGFDYPIYSNELRNFDMIIGNESFEPPTPDLDIVVDVSCNGFADLGNHAGAAEWATDGYDPEIDIPEPGPSPGNYLTASFTQSAWPYGPRFRTMVHGSFTPTEELKTWPLRVETDQVGLVELTFSPDFDATSGVPLLIRDEQTGAMYNLFPNLSFTYENNNPSVRDFLIIVGDQGPPPLWPDEKYLPLGWSMIGTPLMPAPGHSSLAEVILDQINGLSYVYRYLGEDGYELADSTDPAIHGMGYWLAVDDPFYWAMEGEMALEPVSLQLASGWNMIGYPLWFQGDLENIKVEHLDKTYSWLQAVNEGLVLGSVLKFNTYMDQYQSVDILNAWIGYWFGALVEGVSLVFDWENFMELPSRISNPDRTEHPPELHWTTDLKVTDSGGNSHGVSFGVHPEATAGFDAFLDIPMAPSGPNNLGYVGILRPEWDLPLGHQIYCDLVAPDDDPVSWDAEIVLAESGSVTLWWNRQNWPDDLDLQIYLPQSNRVVLQSMRSQNSLRLSAPQGYLVVQFRTPALSGVDDTPSLSGRLGVHPNPFNPQTTISFELSHEGEVEVRIYSVRGEMVSELHSETAGVGRHEVIWTGRDRSGHDVPSGSYFARLYVDGKAVGNVAKMSLIR